MSISTQSALPRISFVLTLAIIITAGVAQTVPPGGAGEEPVGRSPDLHGSPDSPDPRDSPDPQDSPGPSELCDLLDDLLAGRVDDEGFVDYRGLLGDVKFARAWKAFTGLDASALAAWPEAERIAFWINAYNLATLRLIADHYPIEGRFPIDLFYPDNSILMIPGRWGNAYMIAGEMRSLDSIEHEILRKQFDEPRIHFAIVCASIGCPVLRQEAFRGDRLTDQLEDQAFRYFSRPTGLRIDSGRRSKVRLTKILDWFRDDFESLPADPEISARQRGRTGSLVARVARWFPVETRDLLRAERVDFGWISYDWALNERPRKR